MAELSKAYDPKDVEQKWYEFWEENGLFKPDPKAEKPFCIVIPPPNVTGSLHMGHALNNAIQDLIIRYKRMRGFRVLWVPGTDHAGIATQNVVEREVKKEGKKKEDLGRDAFVDKIWEWKKEYGTKITTQLRRLGSSCDWSRERFTMDEGLSRAVRRHFVDLYKEGLIYRGKRIINWCPRCTTALSDIETDYQDKKGRLWHIRYPLASDANKYIVVATTRPETMLGDTAVAVNPKDERYKHMFGKELVLPLVDRKIPIIRDDFVDPEFGTGAVKVTPAHDPNDYGIGERHNLPKINILTKEARITLAEFGEKERSLVKPLEGLDRFKGREALVKMLEEKGYIEKIEEYNNSVGHCYRCSTMIEPYLSDQWFVRVKPLAEKAIAAVEGSEPPIRFVPERWTKVYLQWMVNLKDWCISRQLWWGHRIPAWYCRGQISNECNEIIVSETKPEKCPKCGGANIEQDPDVFDTWFSSALWPFSTLGWPDETEDLKTFYPTDVLVTSYDIISFWVARMIMAGLHFMKKVPFHTVYINSLVKDIHGKKMSKSWGNVIDPLEVIDKAGADALRFTFLSLIAGQGQDIKLSEEKITEGRNFANKLWNVSRFVMMMTPSVPSGHLPLAKGENERGFELADKWILSRYNKSIKQTTEYIESYQFGEAAKLLYEFVWSEFCDWYIEISKIRSYGADQQKKEQVQGILLHVLEGILKLLHPFMPFETEEIYQILNGRESITKEQSIMVQKWPLADEKMIDEASEIEMGSVIELVRSVRNLRAMMNIQHSREIELLVNTMLSAEIQSYIKALTKVSSVEASEKYPASTASAEAGGIKFGIPLEGLIDMKKEAERIQKEFDKLSQEIVKVKARLQDENFKKNATEGSVAKEELKVKEYTARMATLEGFLKALS